MSQRRRVQRARVPKMTVETLAKQADSQCVKCGKPRHGVIIVSTATTVPHVYSLCFEDVRALMALINRWTHEHATDIVTDSVLRLSVYDDRDGTTQNFGLNVTEKVGSDLRRTVRLWSGGEVGTIVTKGGES